MRKIFFTAVLAIGALVSVNAQSTSTNYPPQANCCDWWDYVYLTLDIEPILCLRVVGTDEGEADYDCYTDFNETKVFNTSNPGDKFNFAVWSNLNFDISAHKHDNNYTKPVGAPGPQIPSSGVEFEILDVVGISGIVSPAYKNLPYYNPAALANLAPENVSSESNPTAGTFALRFRQLPIANAWQYAPGDHTLDVHITITND